MTFKLDDEFKSRNPKHSAFERQDLEILLKEEGCIEHALTVGVIGTERLLVDGYTTYDICKQHGIKLTEPRCIVFKDREEALEWIDRRQRGRRNLSAAEMDKKRERRIEQVAEARMEGKSTREIAELAGVSHPTVLADLKEAGGKHLPPEPTNGQIIGKDGKSYSPVGNTKPPILCSRCTRLGPVEGCGNCEEAAAKEKKKAAKKKAAKPKPKIDDSLPKSVKNALADTWHADCANVLNKMRQQCKGAFSWSSYLDASVLDHLKLAEECFLTAIPRKVCPDCKGQKVIDKKPCATCRHGGYLAGQVV